MVWPLAVRIGDRLGHDALDDTLDIVRREQERGSPTASDRAHNTSDELRVAESTRTSAVVAVSPTSENLFTLGLPLGTRGQLFVVRHFFANVSSQPRAKRAAL